MVEAMLDTARRVRRQPGMPAKVFIKTGERTVASYVVKPMRDQMQRAFRKR